MKTLIKGVILSLIAMPLAAVGLAQEEETIVRDIHFPVHGETEFIGDFGADRWGGHHTHAGVDIKAPKYSPVYAAVDGVVTFMPIPEASWGFGIWIKDDEGYEYAYIHLNNDTPGTDDGNGGPEHAYAPGIKRGVRVTRGQHIGWLGDSGNAENITDHLHFEIHLPDGTPFNPYPSLIAALGNRDVNYNPILEQSANPSINDDHDISVTSGAEAPCESGSLIKSPSTTSVYYCGADGKRYVFSNSGTYFSWYDDFSEVVTITEEELAAVPLGGNVTYRPGVRLVKINTDPKVYAVSKGGVLRWITSPEIAAELYGEDWANNVKDIPETFFINYTMGEDIVWE